MVIKSACLFALSVVLLACSEAEDVTRPREFSGVWLYEFEGSTFIEGANKLPKERPAYDRSAWLDYHPDQRHPNQYVELSKYDDYDEDKKCYPVHPFLVTFEGRETIAPNGSGHMGLWASDVMVDRMI